LPRILPGLNIELGERGPEIGAREGEGLFWEERVTAQKGGRGGYDDVRGQSRKWLMLFGTTHSRQGTENGQRLQKFGEVRQTGSDLKARRNGSENKTNRGLQGCKARCGLRRSMSSRSDSPLFDLVEGGVKIGSSASNADWAPRKRKRKKNH